MPVSSQIPGFGLPPALRSLVERHQALAARTASDRTLARRLRASVGASGVEVEGLAFYVHDGAISIYGAVRDTPAREAVVALVASQPGVRRVVDHLRTAAR